MSSIANDLVVDAQSHAFHSDLVNTVNTDLTRNIAELLSQVIGDIDEIQPQDNLFKLGILDSVLLIQLVERIEDTFSISIEDRELSPDYFLSIERISIFIQHKLDNANDSNVGEEK